MKKIFVLLMLIILVPLGIFGASGTKPNHVKR